MTEKIVLRESSGRPSGVYYTIRDAQKAVRRHQSETGLRHIAVKTTVFDWDLEKNVPCYAIQLVIPTTLVDRRTGKSIPISKRIRRNRR